MSNDKSSSCVNTLLAEGGTPPNLLTFSFTLFSLLSNAYPQQPNILLSPYSIASAMALVLAGATPNSPCQAQLQSALTVSSHVDVAALNRMVMDSVNEPIHDGFVSITSATGIWIKGAILDSYVSLVKEIHDGHAQPLPLTYDPINSYIETKTNGMISNMMSGSIDPLTVAILVNAVHFKGLWRKSFDPKHTIKGTFKAMDKDGVGTVEREAMFMQATRRMDVALDVDELDGASMVRLDYGKSLEKESVNDGDTRKDHRRMKKEEDAEFSAIFVLPSKESSDGIIGVFNKLAELSRPNKASSSSQLADILGNAFHHEQINLSLPRFRLSYGTQSISKQLQTMGIQDAFNGRNVFDDMSDDPEVHVDDVFHKAVMEVTEEGTVAAAATVAVMTTRSLSIAPRPRILRFDRPFGVLIVHRSKNDVGWTPLFVGRVDDPDFEF